MAVGCQGPKSASALLIRVISALSMWHLRVPVRASALEYCFFSLSNASLAQLLYRSLFSHKSASRVRKVRTLLRFIFLRPRTCSGSRLFVANSSQSSISISAKRALAATPSLPENGAGSNISVKSRIHQSRIERGIHLSRLNSSRIRLRLMPA